MKDTLTATFFFVIIVTLQFYSCSKSPDFLMTGDIEWTRTGYGNVDETIFFDGTEISAKRKKTKTSKFEYRLHSQNTSYGLDQDRPYKFRLKVNGDKPSDLKHIVVESFKIFSLPDQKLLFSETPLETVEFNYERYDKWVYVNYLFKSTINDPSGPNKLLAIVKFKIVTEEKTLSITDIKIMKKYKSNGSSNLPLISV